MLDPRIGQDGRLTVEEVDWYCEANECGGLKARNRAYDPLHTRRIKELACRLAECRAEVRRKDEGLRQVRSDVAIAQSNHEACVKAGIAEDNAESTSLALAAALKNIDASLAPEKGE